MGKIEMMNGFEDEYKYIEWKADEYKYIEGKAVGFILGVVTTTVIGILLCLIV